MNEQRGPVIRSAEAWAASDARKGLSIEESVQRRVDEVIKEWQMTEQEAARVLALRVQIGVLEYRLRCAYRAMRQAGIDTSIMEDAPQAGGSERQQLPCRWCRATVGHSVGCHAHE